jgi:hypothetical protein
MSLNLSTIEIEQFLSDAHADFQSEGFLLENTIRTKTGTKGSIVHFPVFGEGMANQKAPQDDVTPMNISNRDVTVTLEDWYASEYADRSFKDKIAVNAVQEYSKMAAWAIGRRTDQIIIDTVEALTYSATPSTTQGALVANGGATGFTYDKLREAHKFMRKRSANMGKRTLVIDADAEEDLLNENELINSDFVNKKALESDGLNGMTLLGINFLVMPDMNEGGLTSGQAYMFNEMAVGYASNERLGGDISWENVKTSFLINMWMEAGCSVIDPRGLVQIDYTV